jgi:1-deoxy-D-xylulose-5-phosphate reductoisomerase
LTCDQQIARIILTASGGPFRTATLEETYNATPARALKHPTWQMGPKVTIDSASLTNKALEIVEAHWLFGLPGDKIDVLVHPQSIVHALVEFADGNVMAQLAPPDMRTPIQYALTFPHRPSGVSRKLDWTALKNLEFSQPDRVRFPAVDAAYEIINRGGTAGAIFNAANEVAVEAFLAEKIPFGRITELSRGALESVGSSHIRDLADVHAADAEGRRAVHLALDSDSSTRIRVPAREVSSGGGAAR